MPYFSKASVKKKTSKFALEISCKLVSGAFSFLYVQPILFNLSGGGEPHNVIEDGHRESTASLANRSGIMAEKKHQLTALGIAYEAVIKLGYTHSKLAKLDSSINYPTLRNIRDGKEMKKATERFYLKLFFDLINKEYERRMACGGDGAVSLLIVMKNILEAELK